MGDNVKIIEEQYAFQHCYALKFIRLSKTLEFIGECAFESCESLEVLILPPTVEKIDYCALNGCERLRILILPDTISPDNLGSELISCSDLNLIAEDFGNVDYSYNGDGYVELGEGEDIPPVTEESNAEVNEWLMSYMDEYPFHKLCYNVNVNSQEINDYLNAE